MKKYIINKDTCAVIATYSGSKIISNGVNIISDKSPKYIINNSCKYYGSSLEGRLCGTKTMLGVSYKAPIVVSESNSLIMFPTSSVRDNDCSWINLNQIEKYVMKSKNVMLITFKNGKNVMINLSFGIFDKQILRASRLESVFLSRK